jgi:hypothetical protein
MQVWRAAARHGHLAILKWGHTWTEDNTQEGGIARRAHQWIEGAVHGGHVNVVEWASGADGPAEEREPAERIWSEGHAADAAEAGHAAVLQWMLDDVQSIVRDGSTTMMERLSGCRQYAAHGAAERGDLAMLRCLLSNEGGDPGSSVERGAFEGAAAGGSVAALAPGEYIIQCRFQSKRAQRHIRLQLFPSTFR